VVVNLVSLVTLGFMITRWTEIEYILYLFSFSHYALTALGIR